MKKTIEFDEECPSCRGTGLYVGFAEKDGFAVVCHTCDGTGKHHFEHTYNEFTYRKDVQGVKRVLETNPGIGIGIGTTEEGEILTFESFGGMPYLEWVAGLPFPKGSEMRNYICPAWWYQGADYKQKPDWNECRGVGSFSSCKCFKTKEKCWERFDTEGPEKPKEK
jgi:hypothetical protein